MKLAFIACVIGLTLLGASFVPAKTQFTLGLLFFTIGFIPSASRFAQRLIEGDRLV